MNFLNLPEEYSRKGEFFVLSVPYENSPSYGSGASKGSYEIIKASHEMEYYDEEFDCEPFMKGIITDAVVACNNPEDMIDKTRDKISKIRDMGGDFIIGLGGDHAVTLGLVRGHEESLKDFSVLILDAHSDFRESWNNSRLNHACISRRLSENHKVGLIGVRSQDSDEAKDLKANSNVKVIRSYDLNNNRLNDMINFLGKNIYLSIDVDVFDPSVIKNTGTPEPGGFSWREVINLLKVLFCKARVIGADIVEFAPEENYRAEAYTLARLAYKIMALHSRTVQSKDL